MVDGQTQVQEQMRMPTSIFYLVYLVYLVGSLQLLIEF
jgi:hypothetical protein